MTESFTPIQELYFKALEKTAEIATLEELSQIRVPVSPLRSANLVAAHIKDLRRKLPPGMKIISVRGRGYKLVKES